MDDFGGLAGGGAIALLVAVVTVWRELRKDRRETRSAPLDETTEANVALSRTIERLTTENRRLGERVGALERDVHRRDEQIRDYRQKIEHLESELAKLTREVAAFRVQLLPEPKETP